jgi:MFS family permease
MRVFVLDLYVAKQGQAFGINMAAGNVGVIIAAVLAAIVLTPTNWQQIFIWLVALLLITAGALHSCIDQPLAVNRVDLELRPTFVGVFGDPGVRRQVVGYSLFIFTWQGAAKFLPTFLQVEKAFSPVLASAGFGMLFLVGLFVMPIAGKLGDRLSYLGVGISAIGATAIGLLALVAAVKPMIVMVSVILLGTGLMAFPPVMQVYVLSFFDDTSMGGDFGAFKTVYTGAGSLGPTYVGVIGGWQGFDVAFISLVICLLISGLLFATT